MKPCRYKQLLSNYLDRKLASKQEKMVKEHLPLCSSCKQEWEELIRLKEMCANLPEEELPAGLHQRIMQQVQQKQKNPTDKIVWIRRIAAPLAAAILLFLIGKGLPSIIGNTKSDMQGHAEHENAIMETPEAPEADSFFDIAASEEQGTDMPDSDEEKRSPAEQEIAGSVNQLEQEESHRKDDSFADTPENPNPEGSLDDSDEGIENTNGAGKVEDRDGVELVSEGYELPQPVKIGIGAAVLLAVAWFLIRILKLKR